MEYANIYSFLNWKNDHKTSDLWVFHGFPTSSRQSNFGRSQWDLHCREILPQSLKLGIIPRFSLGPKTTPPQIEKQIFHVMVVQWTGQQYFQIQWIHLWNLEMGYPKPHGWSWLFVHVVPFLFRVGLGFGGFFRLDRSLKTFLPRFQRDLNWQSWWLCSHLGHWYNLPAPVASRVVSFLILGLSQNWRYPSNSNRKIVI
jgi:hypothetical protein